MVIYVILCRSFLLLLNAIYCVLNADNQALQQALPFGAMDLLRSQYCAMHVGLGGGQREHLQIIPLYMLGQNLMIMRITGSPG
jgi:hypothetical protein